MRFNSINEIKQFSFEDCQITKFNLTESSLTMVAEAVIVRPNNSQNSNYTESYADTCNIHFANATLQSAIKDGYKYYDANDNLLDSIPDEALDSKTISTFSKLLENAYLYDIEESTSENDNSKIFTLHLELPKEEEFDTLPTDSYTLAITSDNVTISWDKYLNRVQR